ncbi:hypothetical protein VP01_3607g1 [Puccinia sorghi]|uniref:Uncharacterized protein n=1 Tax=Puccinia sorghi TaxID=27349 RepID=A0A0L6UWZ3_9BASI|nr:hypothetical protein VP01_3607g1 [Puccinia sorghi]
MPIHLGSLMQLNALLRQNKLSHQLNQLYINKMINLQGPQHVQEFNLEQFWKPDETPSANTPFKNDNVPQNLPINCYSSEYIGKISALEKQILSTKPPVDFSNLLSITKSSISNSLNN